MSTKTINDQGAINLIEGIVEQTVKDFMNTTPGSDARKKIEMEITSGHFASLTGLNGSELLERLREKYNKNMSARKGKRNDD